MKQPFQPNTTQTPNFLFDSLMSKCAKHPARFFVLCAIVRKTYGWHKNEDHLAISQIMELTGLTRNAVRDALRYWIKEKAIKLISKGDGRKVSKYRCLLYDYIATNKVNESPSGGQSDDSRGSVSHPLGGQSVTPQNTNKTNSSKLTHQKEEYNPETFRTNVISETKAPEPVKTLTDSLKEIAMRNNLAYSLDRKNEGLFQNKLSIEMSQTNEHILAQAYRFEEILRKEPTLTWLKNDAFGFKFLQFNWGKIDSWHLSKKPIRKLSLVQKEDTSYYDESKKGIAPTLEQLERMYK